MTGAGAVAGAALLGTASTVGIVNGGYSLARGGAAQVYGIARKLAGTADHKETTRNDMAIMMIDRLRENFAQHDLCLQTGFLGTSILMATLTENGMEAVSYTHLDVYKRQANTAAWIASEASSAANSILKRAFPVKEMV